MIKKGILILLAFMLCEFTFFISNETMIFLIYLVGLSILGLGYYKIMEYIINETSRRFKK
jgi:hypothetical protein